MKTIITYFVKYYFFWLTYFILFKVIFLLYNIKATSGLDITEIFNIFLHGSKMDFSAAGYLTMLPGILLSLTVFIKPDIIKTVIKWYTILFLTILTFLGILDTVLYPGWGVRLNAQILPYLSNPKGMIDCVTTLQLIIILIFWAGLVVMFSWFQSKLFKTQKRRKETIRWFALPVMLILSGALMLPIRGGLGTSPLNFSSVYFSNNLYSNHAAYNYFWSFNYAWMHNKMAENPVNYFDETALSQSLRGIPELSQKESPRFISSKNGKQINVILIILESFSNSIIDSLDGNYGVSPHFDKLSTEGILFSNFYATGSRSDKGLSSLLGSFPALLKSTTILQEPDKMKKIKFLPEYFSNENYYTSFYYGGDIKFFNTSLMLIQSGVNKIVSQTDFPNNVAKLQNWGAPDGYLLDRFYNEIKEMNQPFFTTAYTLSSHEPFDIPNYKKIKDESEKGKFLNSVSYTDSCLGSFISKLKQTEIWNNSLVIITSDHTSLHSNNSSAEVPESYKIPMLWIGGAVDSSFVCANTGMQTDLYATLFQQLGIKREPNMYSKNIFADKQYAFYLSNDGWGFVSPETAFYQDIHTGNRKTFTETKNPVKDSLDNFAKSFIQYLHKDFIEK